MREDVCNSYEPGEEHEEGRGQRPDPMCCWRSFEKYKSQDVGPTRARLAELIALFEAHRHTMTIRELEGLRDEIDRLTETLRVERETI
jgi:hypothetical protein